jgi:hypothetical protein
MESNIIPYDVPLRRLGTCGFISAIVCLVSMMWVFAFLVTTATCAVFSLYNPLILEPVSIIISGTICIMGIASGIIALYRKNKIIMENLGSQDLKLDFPL